jgi:hypothetical protein
MHECFALNSLFKLVLKELTALKNILRIQNLLLFLEKLTKGFEHAAITSA